MVNVTNNSKIVELSINFIQGNVTQEVVVLFGRLSPPLELEVAYLLLLCHQQQDLSVLIRVRNEGDRFEFPRCHFHPVNPREVPVFFYISYGKTKVRFLNQNLRD